MNTRGNDDQSDDIPELDDMSEGELGQMLAEAERALRDIRTELADRRSLTHAGIDVEMPAQDLNEARGRWTHFFDFVRQLSAEREETPASRR